MIKSWHHATIQRRNHLWSKHHGEPSLRAEGSDVGSQIWAATVYTKNLKSTLSLFSLHPQPAADPWPPRPPQEPNFTMSALGSESRNHHQLQVQVKEVMGIMTTNVDKMLERDTKLSELVDRAEALRSKASQFVTQGSRVKRTFWWRNCRSRAVLVVIGVIVVVIVIVGIWFGTVSGPWLLTTV